MLREPHDAEATDPGTPFRPDAMSAAADTGASRADNLRGALLMCGAMAAFTVNDTFMKALGAHLPLFQAVFLRGTLVTLALLAVASWRGTLRLGLPRRDWNLLAVRTLAEIGAAYTFITAIFHMPLANATAILQALPLTVTMAGALFLGERVGWRRWTAIGVGFGGMLLVVKPGAEGFDAWSLYVVAAVGFVTLRDIATRRISAAVPSGMVAVVGAAGVTVWGGVMMLAEGAVPVPPAAWALVAGAAGAVMLAYTCSVGTMRVGDVSFVAPFRYSSLLFALVLGFAVFGEFPGPYTLAGAAILMATGVYTLLRGSGRASPHPSAVAGQTVRASR